MTTIINGKEIIPELDGQQHYEKVELFSRPILIQYKDNINENISVICNQLKDKIKEKLAEKKNIHYIK